MSRVQSTFCVRLCNNEIRAGEVPKNRLRACGSGHFDVQQLSGTALMVQGKRRLDLDALSVSVETKMIQKIGPIFELFSHS